MACLGDLYLIETERIFLFFLPAVAVLASRVRDLDPREAAAFSGTAALVFELTLFTLW